MEIKKEENQKLNIYIAVKTRSILGETNFFLSNLHVKVTSYSFSKLCASKQQLRVWETFLSLDDCEHPAYIHSLCIYLFVNNEKNLKNAQH